MTLITSQRRIIYTPVRTVGVLTYTATDTTSGVVTSAGGQTHTINNVTFNTGTGVILASISGTLVAASFSVTIGGITATMDSMSVVSPAGSLALICHVTGMTAGTYTVVLDSGSGNIISRDGFVAGTLTNEIEPVNGTTSGTGGFPLLPSSPASLTIPVNGIGLVCAASGNGAAYSWQGGGSVGYATDGAQPNQDAALAAIAGHFTATCSPSYNSSAGAWSALAAAAWASQ